MLLRRSLAVLVVGTLCSWGAELRAESEANLDAVELEFLQIINEYRTENGAPCLTPSPTMNAAADYMSRAMGELGFFDHSEPPCDSAGDICTGRDPFERIAAFGHTAWSTAAENIAAGSPDAQSTFEQWKTSEGHNRNMLDPGFTSIGIGRVIVETSSYGVYWTNNFSDYVDGTGDCSGEGPNDALGVDAGGAGGSGLGGELGDSDTTLGELTGDGCQAVSPIGSAILWLFVAGGVFRRRLLQGAVSFVESAKYM